MTATGLDAGAPGGAARDALTVTVWTIVSRIAGFLKVAAIGAVLGPTLFGNTFQFINALPNFVFYGFLAGSLFASLLVPALVPHIDRGDRAASERIAGGFLGVSGVLLVAAAPLAVLAGPAVLRVVGQAPADEQSAARLLVVLVLPQLFCYAVVGTGTAAMNACRRFALAAAAPAVESIGTIIVLVWCAVEYGIRTSADQVPTGELVLLGLGSSAAVAAHAAVQWTGARRAGITLLPRAGWRVSEVRAVVRRAIPSLGQAGLMALQMMTMLAFAARVAGGVVGFQIAVNFYFLAIAVSATPAALSVLPRLARHHRDDNMGAFGATLGDGYALGLFLAIPIAAGYLALARPTAETVSFGRMHEDGGATLIAAALVPLAVAVVGQTIFAVSSYASYARADTRSPLLAMAVQAIVCLGITATSSLAHGATVTAVLGAGFALSVVLSGLWLARRVRRRAGLHRIPFDRSVLDAAVGAAVMAGPAWAIAEYGRSVFGVRAGLAVAVLAGAAIFVAVEKLLGSATFGLFVAGLRQTNRETVAASHG